MGDLLDRLTPEQAKALHAAAEDPGTAMLAALSDRRDFEEGEWVLERELDGIRALAVRVGDHVRLLSRRAEPLDAAFPELAAALAAQECSDFAVDGEIVALVDGATDFSRLQKRIGLARPADARRLDARRHAAPSPPPRDARGQAAARRRARRTGMMLSSAPVTRRNRRCDTDLVP
jgi:bifunctional non-homologous end joining protein LigD